MHNNLNTKISISTIKGNTDFYQSEYTYVAIAKILVVLATKIKYIKKDNGGSLKYIKYIILLIKKVTYKQKKTYYNKIFYTKSYVYINIYKKKKSTTGLKFISVLNDIPIKMKRKK